MPETVGMIEHMLSAIRHRRETDDTDGRLVARYVANQDQDAFTELVRRYGPTVWGVCSRLLRCTHDAADASQATFLVLARRADAISPPDRVGAWLFGVARQTALRLRALVLRRHGREHCLDLMAEPSGYPSQCRIDDLKSVLDQALLGLPAKYRLPVILCDLEEKTHRDAAVQLGWPIGTVSGRLVRGRRMLASRLARHGVTIPTGAMLAIAAEGASMPHWLLKTTAQAASLSAATPITATVNGLARGVISTMFLTKCKVAAGIMLTLALSMLAFGSISWAKSPPHLDAVLAGPDHQKQDQAPKQEKKVPETPLRKLQEEKLKVLTKAMHEVHAQRSQGKASYMDAAKSHHDVCKAEFDLATTDEERLKAITKQVKWAKQIEENAVKLNEEGKFPLLDLYKVTTDRIDAEIALEKLKTSIHGVHHQHSEHNK